MSKHAPSSLRVDAEQLRAALGTAAELVALDEIYLPVFLRLERELAALEADNPVERARRIAAAQRAIS